MSLFGDMKLLYIAKFADKDPEKAVNESPNLGIAPFYHYEIKTILNDLFQSVTATSDINYLIKEVERYDYVFTLLNQGKFRNSEVLVSAICEYFKVPYLGAPPNIRALAEDKHLGKLLARHLGIPTPKWQIIERGQIPKDVKFDGPYFIKPRMAASSFGINQDSIQATWQSTLSVIKNLHLMDYDVIVEEFIPGKNVTFPIIGGFNNDFFECIENKSNLKGNVITNSQKRKTREGLKRSIYSGDLACLIKEYSGLIYNETQPLDYARFDFRVNEENGTPYFIEFNVCSNLGSHSTIVQSANSRGLNQRELIEEIIRNSVNRQCFR